MEYQWHQDIFGKALLIFDLLRNPLFSYVYFFLNIDLRCVMKVKFVPRDNNFGILVK